MIDTTHIATDSKLPQLQQATDETLMRQWLASALDVTLKPISEVHHRILKYKPGKHCVLEYTFVADGKPTHSERVIGKVYRLKRGRTHYRNQCDLWQAALAGANECGGRFGMPKPLAYIPELDMVLQSATPGRALPTLSADPGFAAAIRRVAHNLALLHQLRVGSLEKKGILEHLQKFCRPGPKALIDACPDLAPKVQELMRYVSEAEKLSLPVSPVHGDLGVSQIFIEPERAYFVDFDGLCLAPPALDIGNFLVALKFNYPDQSQDLTSHFLEAYEQIREIDFWDGLPAYSALGYLRRATSCFRKGVLGWRNQIESILDAADTLILNEAHAGA